MNCIVRSPDGEMIVMEVYNDNSYEININKVHRANAANLLQSWRKDVALEFWDCPLGHLNGKRVHALQKMVSGINLGKMSYFTSVSVCKTCIKEQHLKAS